MNEAERAGFESDIRALCEKEDFDAAATLLIRGYGGEIFGFLLAVLRDEAAAGDAFSAFAEAVWRGMPTFTWGSSVRTWAYAVARNMSRTIRRDAARRDRLRPHVGDSALEDVADAIRTSTLAYLRTDHRSRLEALRAALSPEDRALLVLRVDRGLAWPELAKVLNDSESEEPLDDAALLREASRLRKRFQIVKDRLRELARAAP